MENDTDDTFEPLSTHAAGVMLRLALATMTFDGKPGCECVACVRETGSACSGEAPGRGCFNE